MRKVELTNSKLFKNLIEIEYDNSYVDLHSNFVCNNIEFGSLKDCLKINFISIDSEQLYNRVLVTFEGAEILKMSLPLQKNFNKEITLDNFYRGRFEENGELFEFSNNKKAYYYIEFYEDYFIELFAYAVDAQLINA